MQKTAICINREACVDMLFEKVSAAMTITRDQYDNTLIGWKIDPVIIDDEHIGVVMLKNHEIHMCLEPSAALRHARRIIKQYVLAPLKENIFLTTIAMRDDQDSKRFLKRLGFHITRFNGEVFTLRLDKLAIY